MGVLILLVLCLGGSDGTDGERVGSKELVLAVKDNVGNGTQQSGHKGCQPVDKVVGVIGWVDAGGSHPVDVPGGGKHGVDGGTGGREEFDNAANGNGRQSLFDDVVVFSEIELPIELFGDCWRVYGVGSGKK